ncbi:hypothetical protein BB559_007353 [Furculomyces boomerangus]|uniref:Uncharacterized protein n=2 Tax=Harpellales TaxID=61421 RepID=A0A2T9XXN3_9FUNG|nr:hypothetical protein BB559_007353 [Furculomyces boomerangus]PVZ97094.1 hypothetical protein BB558_006969 [Smittium angustum]PVZ99811.1 hypothetical protein BB558_004149 [Smittium angustum]
MARHLLALFRNIQKSVSSKLKTLSYKNTNSGNPDSVVNSSPQSSIPEDCISMAPSAYSDSTKNAEESMPEVVARYISARRTTPQLARNQFMIHSKKIVLV